MWPYDKDSEIWDVDKMNFPSTLVYNYASGDPLPHGVGHFKKTGGFDLLFSMENNCNNEKAIAMEIIRLWNKETRKRVEEKRRKKNEIS